MTFTHEELFIIQIIVLLLQVGQWWFQARKVKPEIAKTQAEEKSSLGDTAESVSKVAETAWSRIRELEKEIEAMQEKLQALKRELQSRETYQRRLEALLVENKIPIPPFEEMRDTKDRMKPVEAK